MDDLLPHPGYVIFMAVRNVYRLRRLTLSIQERVELFGRVFTLPGVEDPYFAFSEAGTSCFQLSDTLTPAKRDFALACALGEHELGVLKLSEDVRKGPLKPIIKARVELYANVLLFSLRLSATRLTIKIPPTLVTAGLVVATVCKVCGRVELATLLDLCREMM